MTEEGKKQSQLEVPDMLNEHPVVRIAESAFSENTGLAQVTLAAGVAVVEDGVIPIRTRKAICVMRRV